MLILVANLGSTSFKYKLFAMGDGQEDVLATGAADRIGPASGGQSAWEVSAGETDKEGTADLPDHAAAIALHLEQLEALGVAKAQDIQAIGFKAVHGGPISGAVEVTDEVIETMQKFTPLAPAHNPPYIAAMKGFADKLPSARQVAAFETAFHQTIPLYRAVYATPWEWIEKYGVRRYGFHGASHRYIATRMAEISPNAKKIISLHLGGSCSISAIDHGQSVANSFGTTPQTGVFHNNRVGEFDSFAMQQLMANGIDLETIYKKLGKEGGMLGLSGVSADMRDVEEAAAQGNERAKLAVDAFVDTCRQYVGAYLAVLGGADAIVFTGGIGQYGKEARQAICDSFGYAGITMDAGKNMNAKGKQETRIDADDSGAKIWVLPTNEELIVARQTYDVLDG